MGDELVTDSSLNNAGGGGESRQPPLRYREKFESLCAYYMSLGMTYEEYWDGDNMLPKYYRQMNEIERERKNQEMWLQGMYFYEAMLDVFPVFNPLCKRNEPYPYRDMPIPITEKESKRNAEREKEKMLEKGREAMRIMMNEFNKRFTEKQKEGGE